MPAPISSFYTVYRVQCCSRCHSSEDTFQYRFQKIFLAGGEERSYKHKWDPILNQYVRSSKIEFLLSIKSFAKGEDMSPSPPPSSSVRQRHYSHPIHCALYLSPGAIHRASTSIPTNFVKKPKQFHDKVNQGPSVISF